MADELRSLRNYFYVGQHAKVVEEAGSLDDLEKKMQAERDVYVLRSLVGLGKYDEVHKGVDKGSCMAAQAVNLLAKLKESDAEKNREEVFDTLREWLSDAAVRQDPLFVVVAAQIFLESGLLKQALRLTHAGEHLEMKAVALQAYIRLRRYDLAQKALMAMQVIDDDDALTHLGTAWLCIAQGGDKVNEAVDVLQQLVDMFRPTALLNNLLAACAMQRADYAQAFQQLKSSRQLAIQSGTVPAPETLINSLTCIRLMGKGNTPIGDKVLEELKKHHPEHPWLKQQEALSEEIAQCVNNVVGEEPVQIAAKKE